MNEEWIEQMREKMADYQWPAPELSWDELDRALAAGKVRKTRVLWLRRMAAAAAVLLIAGVGYWGFLQENHSDENHGDRLENHGDWHNNRSAAQIRVPVPVILAQDPVQPQEPTPAIPQKSTPAILASSAQKPNMTDAPVTETTLVSENHGDRSLESDVNQGPVPVIAIPSVIYPSDLRQQKHINNRLTAKAYMSSTMAGGQTESFNLQRIKDINPIEEIKDTTHIKHRQPIRFGLSLRYRLANRWSVESGLTYTRLSSDITTKEKGVATMTEQRLNYIGLPLNISYDLWKSRHFGLYVTAGGTIEKQLDASSWQFSLNGAAGAEYKLTDVFSLYAEPGLGYYFNDGSTTPTIYQDRPLNFNLSVGFRFNLK